VQLGAKVVPQRVPLILQERLCRQLAEPADLRADMHRGL
jgi:hypothetical protein